MKVNLVNIGTLKTAAEPPGFALWNLGFRPFYLAGATWAAVGMVLWMLQWLGLLELQSHLRGVNWHMHEMIFGYAFTIVIGFLLTAVRTWTGQPTPTGAGLAWMVGTWLAARVLYLTPWSQVGIVVETLFFAMAAWGIALPIYRGGNRQNFFFVLLLTLAALLNLIFHYAVVVASSTVDARTIALYGLDVLAFIIVVVSGRVMPMFTRNGAPGSQPKTFAWLERASLVAIFLTAMFSALPSFPLLAALAGFATFATCILLFIRWYLCAPFATLGNPILWILHAALFWLPVGYLLRTAAMLFNNIPASLGIHAITVGVIGGMTLAMMTRTARGHTGRPLHASPLETTAYVLILMGAITRLLVPLILPTFYVEGVLASALLWAAAFMLYLWVFAPWLTMARADGKDG